MKFILFNVTVIAALVYLFDGKKISVPEHVKVTANHVIGSAKSIVSQQLEEIDVNPGDVKYPANQSDAGPLVNDRSEWETLGEKPNIKEAVEPAKIPDQTMINQESPENIERELAEEDAAPENKFLSPAERQRELQKLAQDMEQYFLKLD